MLRFIQAAGAVKKIVEQEVIIGYFFYFDNSF